MKGAGLSTFGRTSLITMDVSKRSKMTYVTRYITGHRPKEKRISNVSKRYSPFLSHTTSPSIEDLCRLPGLRAETVKGAALPLERVDDVKRGD